MPPLQVAGVPDGELRDALMGINKLLFTCNSLQLAFTLVITIANVHHPFIFVNPTSSCS